MFIQSILDKRKLIGVKSTKAIKITAKDCNKLAPKINEAIKNITIDKPTVTP